jgi:type II pantothenate kinase
MHFVKFETARIDDCLEFIEAKGLHRCTGKDGLRHEVRVKATGGGAVRFAGECGAVVPLGGPLPFWCPAQAW